MRLSSVTLGLTLAAVGTAATLGNEALAKSNYPAIASAQIGARPFYLVDKLKEGDLKDELIECAEKKKSYKRKDFSIGHRGSALQFPEHTRESYVAAARMGAGIVECDATFTSDADLVCRHAQCDLHTTTNILVTPLAGKCRVPFTPADPVSGASATAMCCTSDLTTEEFLSLKGKMDASNPNATTPQEFLGGTADFRTDLYATGGTLLTHAQSIELIDSLGADFTPELKSGIADDVKAVFGTQAAYAQALIDDYEAAGIDPKRVWAQSFNPVDVLYWVDNAPEFGEQAVLLDDFPTAIFANQPPTFEELRAYKDLGVNIIAPPMPALLTVDGYNNIVPSMYGPNAHAAGMDIISWTLERSGRIVEDGGGYYYQTTLPALENDGDILVTMDVLAQQVGIIGLFSDWPATTTFYANCKDTKKFTAKGHRKGSRKK